MATSSAAISQAIVESAATENIHVHVHHMTNDATMKPRAAGTTNCHGDSTLPRSAQSREQEGQKRQQTPIPVSVKTRRYLS